MYESAIPSDGIKTHLYKSYWSLACIDISTTRSISHAFKLASVHVCVCVCVRVCACMCVCVCVCVLKYRLPASRAPDATHSACRSLTSGGHRIVPFFWGCCGERQSFGIKQLQIL